MKTPTVVIYHGDCTEGPGISSSGLRRIEAKTPLHYWATSYLNPDRIEEEPKDHFTFGKAAHDLLLGEGQFRAKFAIRPDQWENWRKPASQDWRKEQQAAGLDVLTPEDLNLDLGSLKLL